MNVTSMVDERPGGGTHGARFGLSSFALKVIACTCMLVDHIGAYIPGMPEELRWVGRLSMPIFLFLIGWGCEYTRDRKRYLLRLYAAGVLMAVLQTVWNDLPNIFLTLFQVALIITLIDVEDWKTRLRNIGLYVLWQVGWTAVLLLLFHMLHMLPTGAANILESSGYLIFAVLGLAVQVDYGLYIVVMGVMFWLCRNSRVKLSAIFIAFTCIWMLMVNTHYGNSLLYRIIPMLIPQYRELILEVLSFIYTIFGFSPMSLDYSLLEYPQWMMIFSLPFMLLYNRQHGWGGKGAKWFFYVFYPTHILILYFIGKAMGA